MSTKRITALLLLGALTSAGLACSHRPEDSPAPAVSVRGDEVDFRPEEGAPVAFPVAPAVTDAPLESPPVTARIVTIDALTSPGYAPLAGQVVSVAVRLGDTVKKGDRLVQVRTADLAGLRHDLRASKLATKTKESIVERTRQLVEARAASQNDLLVAQSELEETRFSAQAAAAKLQSLSVVPTDDSSYWILAQRDGVLVSLEASSGRQVGPSDERPVVTVADLSEVWVLGDVPARDATTLVVGSQADIFVPGRADKLRSGQVEIVADVVDPERQTVPIRVRADNKDRALRPNSYVNLVFHPDDSQRILQVPSAAIVSDGARSVVFVRTPGGTYKRRVVEVGQQTRERAEILSGLAAGEEVVVSGALLLLNAVQLDG